ncbi:hypothetical protein ACR720_10230 [Sphingomonas parapaucimobilis]|uniref:hypothetical protein n=1 Tax=Sphingomonas parapaucimobilis TaxID=28213 RepID=UPI0039EBC46B
MLPEWLEMRDALARVVSEHRILCNAPKPDAIALSRNRWLLSNASRQRANWLMRTANPIAECLAHTPGGAAWLAVQATMPAYRQRISGFVSAWPIEEIITDWDGYRRGVAHLRTEVTAWLRNEEFAIRALAAEWEAAALPPMAIPVRHSRDRRTPPSSPSSGGASSPG